jgi:hypothetical protein
VTVAAVYFSLPSRRGSGRCSAAMDISGLNAADSDLGLGLDFSEFIRPKLKKLLKQLSEYLIVI